MSEVKKSSKAADEKEFHGKRILVTGGTRGIGAAIVDRLSSGGGKVITTGRSLPVGTSRKRFVQADISNQNGIDQLVKAVRDRLGGLDILIHNVGGSAAGGGGALALSDDDWQQAFDTNLFAAVRLDRAFPSVDVATGLWRDHPYLVDPKNATTLRFDPRLRRRQGSAD